MRRRVVVTGIGALSPCGSSAPETWANVRAARTGIGPITRFPCEDWPVRIAGEIDSFDGAARLGRREVRRMDLFTQYAVVATDEAVADAGLELEREDPTRVGVYIGSGIGGLREITETTESFLRRGYKGVSPFFVPKALTNLAGGVVAMRLNAQGPHVAITTACATGNHAIGEAWRAIRAGDAEVILAGGTEAPLVPVGVAGFMVMKALSRRNTPDASRPFDATRDGFVIAEGAATMVLEELEHARARGAKVYAELVGYGQSNDAFHLTAPGNSGATRCMALALRSAGVAPDQVDYINAHGTSTPANDANESRCVRELFGEHADRLMISSTKSVTGHLLGAAGGLEAVLTVMAVRDGVVPPTAHLETPDPECDLDYVPGEARESPVEIALSNAFGFGGVNATLAFRAFRG